MRLLLAASTDYDVRLYEVITMRSDYLGECARFTGLADALNGSQRATAADVPGPYKLCGQCGLEPGWENLGLG